MKKFNKRFLSEVCGFNEEEAKKTMDAQQKFPELLMEVNEKDFIIDGKKLCEQMNVKNNFNTWLMSNTSSNQGKLIKYRMVEDVDYTSDWEIPNDNFTVEEVKNMTSQKRSINGITNKINLTLSCAKKIAMRQNNEAGDLICDYFILMEKAVKGIKEHQLIREPEKENYNKMKEEIIKDFESKHTDTTEMDRNYLMIRESNMINTKLIGYTAGQVREKLGYKDVQTREHLLLEQNKVIDYLELIIYGLVVAGIDFEGRSKIIGDICKSKYSNLRMDLELATK